MKNKYIIVFSLCTLFVLCLAGCTPKYVYYKGIEIESSKLSAETLSWLEKYNAESEEAQDYIVYLPPELRTVLTEMGVNVEEITYDPEEVIFEKPVTVITKILTVEKWEEKVTSQDGKEKMVKKGRFLISTDDLYWCEYDNIDKLKAGYNIELLYSSGLKEGEILTIIPDSVTIISATYNYFDFYLNVIDALWNEKESMNNGVSAVVGDFAEFKYFNDNHKKALFYVLTEKYGVEFKEGSSEVQNDDELLIKLHFGNTTVEGDVYSLSAIKQTKDKEEVRFSNCSVKSNENQLIWSKK